MLLPSCRDGKEAGEDAAAIKRQLISSVGTQHAAVYGVEGTREVVQALSAGLAFVTTGNLAGSLAGVVVNEVGQGCGCIDVMLQGWWCGLACSKILARTRTQ